MQDSMLTDMGIIRMSDLQRRLTAVAQVRAIIVMGSVFPAVLLAGLVMENLDGDSLGSMVAIVLVFGIPLLVSWLMTICYCRGAVKCPHCGHSLWNLGTGNFKPRRMRVRRSHGDCPGCRMRIE